MISSLQPSRRIKVTVRREDFPAWLPFTTGIVLVDGQRSGVLVGGKARTFHVAPGEHTIGVVLNSFQCLETEPLRMEEGDRIDLVCGRGPRRLRLLTPISFLAIAVGCLFVGVLALNWIAPRPSQLAELVRGSGPAVVASLAVVLMIAAVTRWDRRVAPPYLRRNNGKKKKPLVVDL